MINDVETVEEVVSVNAGPAPSSKKVRTSFLIESELAAWLKETAAANKVSVSSLISKAVAAQRQAENG